MQGTVIRSSVDNIATPLYKQLCLEAFYSCQNMTRDIDPENTVNLIRMSTTKLEFVIAVEFNSLLMVIQQTDSSSNDLSGNNVLVK
ncbi:MAG: hypothetical protein MHPSP_000352 [Paramarteilia canceri]